MRRPKDPMTGYKPIAWPSTSKLSPDEQQNVELQRRDLWRHGIQKEPMLTRLAFEFGAVLTMLQKRKSP